MPRSNPTLCGSIAGTPGTFGVAMHTAAYRALGLDWVYVAFGTEDTAAAVQAMRTLGIRGLGVTMPHKLAIARHLDVLDDTAMAIGAVNTVVNDAGRLTGHNVDWIGAVRALGEATPLDGRRAAVLGAGGGARSIVYGLIRAGCRVTIYNRNEARGRALAESFEATWGGSPAALTDTGDFDILANATSVGFHAPEDTPVAADGLRPGLVVFDAVPQPIETRLVREAAARGCTTVPGVRMQLHQAAEQVHLYTGREPDLTVMERALREALAGRPVTGTPPD
jgi:shikimate dehydrogenase